jgi:hypothetical protein
LELDKLGNSDPDKKYFPDYDVSLRDSFAKETELFRLSQLRDDRPDRTLECRLHDASGAFVDGTSTNGVVELRHVLLQRPDAFRTTITEKLLIYSSGGSVGPSRGMPETLIGAREILRGVQSPRWSALIAAIVRTKPFARE